MARKHTHTISCLEEVNGVLICKKQKEVGSATFAAYVAHTAAKRYREREGSMISAGLREHWPTAVKDRIRYFAHATSELKDAARAHWQAAGKRGPVPLGGI